MTRRLLVGYLGLTLFVLVALEVPLGLQNQRTQRRDLERKIEHDATVLASVAESAFEVEAVEGEQLALEGDFGYALYAIESGTADVSADGKALGSLGPGDVFGEIAVLASGRRTATVVATTPMRLIALFKRDVWALERRDPAGIEQHILLENDHDLKSRSSIAKCTTHAVFNPFHQQPMAEPKGYIILKILESLLASRTKTIC